MYKSIAVAQPSLFTHREMAALYAPAPRWADGRRSFAYDRWWCSRSRARERQRYECLTRQKFRCDYCGYMLNTRFYDVHHTSYEHLGYEEASDLIAVHRRCHRILEEARRREIESEVCGCAVAA